MSTNTALDDIKARVEGHTEGPWTPQEYDHNPGDQGVPIIGGGEPGSMEGHLIAYALTLSDEQKCVADAELVAAAPKLLAALEAVLNLAKREPRFRPRMYGGEYFPVNVSADEIIEAIEGALR